MTSPRTLHLSASAMSAYKACPTRFRYGYIEGIRQEKDTESQRMGTNWHAMHEVYRTCQNGGVLNDGTFGGDPLEAAMRELNDLYEKVPDGFDAYAWEIERTILAMSFAGHVWYYQNDKEETLATEVGFKLPLRHPKTGLPLAEDEVIRIGKIDRIVRYNGKLSIADYKSTSKPIDADSDFWNHLRLDSQISIYVDAAKEMAKSGELAAYGITPQDEITGAFYDVWLKPKIRPKMLTQADTETLLLTGKYCESNFGVLHEKPGEVKVNGIMAELDQGKKGFAIRETPAMFGARLLADIYERPTFYFARREIPRIDADIKRFRGQMYSAYQSMKAARDSGHWIENEHSCNATFLCPYATICWHGVDVTKGQTPPGFKRIFTDLTLNNEQVEV